MNNKIFGVLLGIIVSVLFYHILSQRCSIVIGSGIIEKYKDYCVTANNRCYN